MRNIFSVVCAAAMMIGAVGCSETQKPETPEAKIQNDLNEYYLKASDTLSIAAARIVAIDEALNIERMPEAAKASVNKDEYLAGLLYVLQADTSSVSYINGCYAGMSLLGLAMKQNFDNGPKLDLRLAYEAFSKAFKQDSITDSIYINAQADIQRIIANIDARRRDAEYQIFSLRMQAAAPDTLAVDTVAADTIQ